MPSLRFSNIPEFQALRQNVFVLCVLNDLQNSFSSSSNFVCGNEIGIKRGLIP